MTPDEMRHQVVSPLGIFQQYAATNKYVIFPDIKTGYMKESKYLIATILFSLFSRCYTLIAKYVSLIIVFEHAIKNIYVNDI